MRQVVPFALQMAGPQLFSGSGRWPAASQVQHMLRIHHIRPTVLQNTAPVHQNTAPVPQKTTPVYQNATLVPQSTARVQQNADPVQYNIAPVQQNIDSVQQNAAPVPLCSRMQVRCIRTNPCTPQYSLGAAE